MLEKMRTLKELLEEGLINQNDYDTAKRQILNKDPLAKDITLKENDSFVFSATQNCYKEKEENAFQESIQEKQNTNTKELSKETASAEYVEKEKLLHDQLQYINKRRTDKPLKEIKYHNPSRGWSEPVHQTPAGRRSEKSSVGILLLFLLAGILIFAGVSGLPDEPAKSSPEPTYPPVSVWNGKVYKQPTGECPCTITVETETGHNYYIYMKDIDGDNDLSFYVEGGNTVTKDIPLGTYKFYYCSGDIWYGFSHKFADTTVASTSDELFPFEDPGDAWTVTLYRINDGNFTTTQIPLSDFPD